MTWSSAGVELNLVTWSWAGVELIVKPGGVKLLLGGLKLRSAGLLLELRHER